MNTQQTISNTADTIAVSDAGVILEIPFDACVAYHGRDSIGGLALGFRLMQYAFERLSPGTPPERRSISFFTAFPGAGVRDAVEMVSRAVTRGAYTVNPEADVPAPEGVTGRMYFEIAIGGQRLCLALAEGALGAEFVETGRHIKRGNPGPELARRWTALKEALAVDVLASRPGDLFVESDKGSFARQG